MDRRLPSAQEAALIFAARRTRPLPGPPPTAGRALNKTLKALDARFGQNADGLKARWTEIVGAALARRTEPIKLVKAGSADGASLELRVDGPSASLIQHQAPDILGRVNLFLGAGAVTRLRIVQGPLRGFAKRDASTAKRAAPRARGPLDAAAERALADSLGDLPEGGLKDALLRLGREVLRAG